MNITRESIRSALSTFRYETARRLAKEHLEKVQGAEKTETALLLYDALVRLGDVKEGMRVLDGVEETFDVILRKVEGLDRATFLARYGVSVDDAFADAIAEVALSNFWTDSKTHLQLNARGLDMLNTVLVSFR